MSERHAHRCMRCKQEFPCQTPGVCTAKADVLPRIVLPSGEVVDHCEWQPTERFRAKPCYSCTEGTQRPVEFFVCDHCGDFGVGPDSPQLALINKVELSGYARGRAESAAEVAQLRAALAQGDAPAD